MKTIDVSKNVMNDIVRLERTRTKWWMRRFFISLVILLGFFIFFVWILIQIISQQQGWDLLALFGQDPEIIASYWQDTLWVFWEESPHRFIYVVGIVFLVIIAVIVLTSRRRKIVRKKLHQLEKYS